MHPQRPEAHWPLTALLENAPLRALSFLVSDGNTQARKGSSEDKNKNRREYLNDFENLKTSSVA